MAGKAIPNVYAWGDLPNGRVPYDQMVRLDDIPGNWFANDSMYAHPETAARIRWIYAECQRQGLKSVRPNECYRAYATQEFWKTWWTNAGNPGNAATPGGSPHGFGYACDWDYAQSEYAAFVAICHRAGELFNISGEDWHNAPLADSQVDLAVNANAVSISTPTKGKHMYVKHVVPFRNGPSANVLSQEGADDRVVTDDQVDQLGNVFPEAGLPSHTDLQVVEEKVYDAARVARGVNVVGG